MVPTTQAVQYVVSAGIASQQDGLVAALGEYYDAAQVGDAPVGGGKRRRISPHIFFGLGEPFQAPCLSHALSVGCRTGDVPAIKNVAE